MATYSIIDKLYEENQVLIQYLDQQKETSLRSSVDAHFRKVLLLAIASYFEHEITELLIRRVVRKTENDVLLISFVKKKAIERQYHTYFDWSGKNANQFLGLFGSDFKDQVGKHIKDTEGLSDAVKAFLELGDTRNELVHLNFANYPMEKTAEEIYTLYRKAIAFVDYLVRQFDPPTSP